ncbi:helix-turn-helix domain-containing protein [Ktedonobacter robiniae]|uniref:HTH cro/C1-type domain-containing protein n=1 Tax=Ktedonobacter robiniae TaxID=2778365 RepID=A0ABQ3UU94_9CHLR|nr:helix-turn-helix domain-containing protein [Ktedonobacter robiniae]GHO56162.1 hypothetical protein KSB_46370 [Ktedonobacter robiniae]
MIKKARTSLIEERKRQRWSQQELADRLGTTRHNVSRWEAGMTTPGPYFRARLCEVFGKLPQELGLLGDTEAGAVNDLPLKSAPHPHLSDPALPLSPEQLPTLIGRQTFVHQLVQELCRCRHNAFALTGLPGIGKTALAVALAHHPQVRQQFQDGILWVGLGQYPEVLESMYRWGTLLGITPTEAGQLTTPDAWARRLYQQIGQRRMLLILDDAWDLSDAVTFQIGGTNCVHLLTTRIPVLAHTFAPEQVFHVPELNEEEGAMLLGHIVSQASQQLSASQMRALVHSVGGLPLALVLMGGYLYVQAQSGQPRRLQRACEQLQQNVERRLHLNRPQTLGQYISSLPIGTSLSLQVAIDISVHRIPVDAQRALHALSLFSPKPYSFSEEAALAVCNMGIDVLDLLADSGLLGTHQSGRYHLHQTIVDYAQLQPPDPEAKMRLVTFFVEFVCEHSDEHELLEQDLHTILTAFAFAREGQLFPALVRGSLAFMPFLSTLRLFDLADRLLTWAQEAATALADWESLAHMWRHRGHMAELRSDLAQAEYAYLTGLAIARERELTQLTAALFVLAGGVIVDQGDYLRAETYLQEGLAMATTLDEQEQRSIALKNLGEIADNLGDPRRAQTLYLESLAIARQQENWKVAGALLQDLGSQAAQRGEYEQAEAYYQEGLTYAEHLMDLQRQSAILMNQGLLASYRREYERALTLSLQSLSLARKIRNGVRISSVLQNLGIIERCLGHYAQAEAYLKESLDVAHAMGHRWLICETTGEWGTLYVYQQKLDAAWETFQQMLKDAMSMRAPLLQAQALFGLAQVEDQRGRGQQALQYARESQTLFRELEHQQVEQIEQWLAERL